MRNNTIIKTHYFIVSLEEILKRKSPLILVLLAYGIALGFNWQVSLYLAFFLLLCSGFLYLLAKNHYVKSTIRRDLIFMEKGEDSNYLVPLLSKIFSLALVSFLLGMTASAVSLSLLNKNQLPSEIKNVLLIGKVREFDLSEKGIRLYLDDNYQLEEGVLKKLNLGIIRISIKRKLEVEQLIGEWIKVKVDLMPPPGPALPNSFNFAEFALFKGIGALGYSFFTPRILEDFEDHDSSLVEKIDLHLKKLRKKLVFKIKAAMSEPSAGILAAMLLGENAQIGTADYYAIRVAGLAHIIAISGMHVVVVVAIAFFISRAFLLYFIPFVMRFDLALYLPVPKVAAFLAIFLSTFYVLLAGAPLSAQRALITSSLVLICLIFDKSLDPIKSLMMVAIILLLLKPESLFSAGLQMSFAACFALITAFQMTDPWVAKIPGQYFIKLAIASLAASLGVAPLILYHFNQFAPYGLIANLFCVPLSDFVIMPLALISLLLMPVGLEKFPLIPVEISINFMLDLARKISTLPYADLYFPSLTKGGLIIVSLGLFFFVVTTSRKFRFIGVLIALLGFTSFEDYSTLQLLISSKSFAIRNDLISEQGNSQFIFSSKRRDFFLHEVWMSKIGRDNFSNKGLGSLVKIKKNAIKNCTEKLCFFTLPDSSKGLIYYDDAPFATELCKDLTLFINIKGEATCPGTTSINSSNLYNIHLIYFDKEGLKITKVNR
jgi:competence protein ComEC